MIFTVPPFGMNTTTFPLTKVVRSLIKYWRLDAVIIAYFLVDRISIKLEILKPG